MTGDAAACVVPSFHPVSSGAVSLWLYKLECRVDIGTLVTELAPEPGAVPGGIGRRAVGADGWQGPRWVGIHHRARRGAAGVNYRRWVFVAAVAKCQEADESFPTITPHDLRHTAASLTVSAGANVKAVQRMLGHVRASMTLDVYADLFDDDLDNVAEHLDAAIKSAAAVPLRSQPAK
jgi:hypothetical protein